jgi:hypothetical protein
MPQQGIPDPAPRCCTAQTSQDPTCWPVTPSAESPTIVRPGTSNEGMARHLTYPEATVEPFTRDTEAVPQRRNR